MRFIFEAVSGKRMSGADAAVSKVAVVLKYTFRCVLGSGTLYVQSEV